MSLLDDLEKRKEYLLTLKEPDNIPGSHDYITEIRKDLGYYMMQLKKSHHNSEEETKYLEKVHNELQLNDLEDFKKQYDIYLRLLSEREDKIEVSNMSCGFFRGLKPIEPLKRSLWNHWGCYKQFKSGKCIIDAINANYNYRLHSVWGCLLLPTGGIAGESNKELWPFKWNTFVGLHSAVHDAAGYLYLYHNLTNCGYNYLDTWWTFFPKTSGLSCQSYGLKWWMKNC